jgi:single-strand DNA-binding protein
MPSYNKVILVGNLTRDPELRYTPAGRAIAKLGLAVNRSWRSESGETREETTFVDVDAFGKQAEVLAQYLRKGRPVMVEGRLRLDQWEDKQTGQRRSRLGVVLESFQFLDSGQGRSDSGGGGGMQGGPAAAPTPPPATSGRPSIPNSDGMGPEEDDVPF